MAKKRRPTPEEGELRQRARPVRQIPGALTRVRMLPLVQPRPAVGRTTRGVTPSALQSQARFETGQEPPRPPRKRRPAAVKPPRSTATKAPMIRARRVPASRRRGSTRGGGRRTPGVYG